METTIKKPRKPKPVNFTDKKTFRLGETHLDNLGKGADFFKEDESSYIRRLLEIDPRKIKGLLNVLEKESQQLSG
jgi:hypothetical protein